MLIVKPLNGVQPNRQRGAIALVRDYEVLPETSEAFIYLAMIRIMLRRLAYFLRPQYFSNTLSDLLNK
jgi:hypothetical protein